MVKPPAIMASKEGVIRLLRRLSESSSGKVPIRVQLRSFPLSPVGLSEKPWKQLQSPSPNGGGEGQHHTCWGSRRSILYQWSILPEGMNLPEIMAQDGIIGKPFS